MLKKLLILIACICSLFIVFLIFSDISTSNDFDNLDEIDKSMFKQLSSIYKEFSKNPDQLWNETFRLNELPLILVRVNKSKGIMFKYSYLINITEMADIFNTKEMINMPKDLPPISKLGRLSIKSSAFLFPSNFGTTNINNQQVFYFKFNPDMIATEDPFWGFSTFLIHESFHAYKQKDWIYDSEGDRVKDYPFDINQLSLLGIELNLLDAALNAPNPKDIDILLKDVIILRAYRYKKWPQLIDETKSEAMEGSSVYLEDRYAQLRNRISRLLLASDIKKHSFMNVYNAMANGNAPPSLLERHISYDRGASLSILMDKLSIPWKDLIDSSLKVKGKTQYEILYDYYNMKDLDLDIEVERIKSLDGFEIYKERAEKIIQYSKPEGNSEKQ